MKGTDLLAASSGKSDSHSLIIDGKALIYALEEDMKDLFLDLATDCATVICCRSTPKQKALVSYVISNFPFNPNAILFNVLCDPTKMNHVNLFIVPFHLHQPEK